MSTPLSPGFARVPAAVVGAILALCGSAQARWVGSWSAAPAVLGTAGLRDTTVRQFMRLSIGGVRIRLRFSNETGTDPLAISDAHVALPGSAPGSIDPSSDHAVTFGGAVDATLAPGSALLSDPVALSVPPLTRVAVSAVFGSASRVQVGHAIGGDTSFLVAGDHAGDATLPAPTTSTARYNLSGVDVDRTGLGGASVGVLGDSITDGFGSTLDRARRWPDRLADRLTSRAGGTVYGVLNDGLAGNGVLAGQFLSVNGMSALARLDRDLLARPGLTWLVVLEGINDIAGATAVDGTDRALIDAYGQVIQRAHDRGIRVMGATLTPFAGYEAFSPPRERLRRSVNAWIRDAGAFDAVVDFDAVAADPSRPARLRPGYDSGDHLHLNDAGYRALGDAVPLDQFD